MLSEKERRDGGWKKQFKLEKEGVLKEDSEDGIKREFKDEAENRKCQYLSFAML